MGHLQFFWTIVLPSQLFLRIDVLDRFDLGTGVASGDFFEPSLGGSERKVDLLLECVLEVSMVQRYTKYLPDRKSVV